MDVSTAEIRVLGCLVEKQLTTPQQYPLTLNALTLACNQSSNRDPVVDYDEATVEAAVTSAKTKGLAGFVHPAHGRSAMRFRHALDEALGLADGPLALLAVLMLRGPQTLAELRGRTERMVRFADLHEVEAELDALAARDEPLVVRLARGPGQKEDRYASVPGHVDDGAPPAVTEPARHAPVAGPGSAAEGAPTPAAPGRAAGPGDLGVQVERLRSEVARLGAEVEGLRRDLDDLREQLGA